MSEVFEIQFRHNHTGTLQTLESPNGIGKEHTVGKNHVTVLIKASGRSLQRVPTQTLLL